LSSLTREGPGEKGVKKNKRGARKGKKLSILFWAEGNPRQSRGRRPHLTWERKKKGGNRKKTKWKKGKSVWKPNISPVLERNCYVLGARKKKLLFLPSRPPPQVITVREGPKKVRKKI